jgi:hypothetical protein
MPWPKIIVPLAAHWIWAVTEEAVAKEPIAGPLEAVIPTCDFYRFINLSRVVPLV